jgi:hypothetical protein
MKSAVMMLTVSVSMGLPRLAAVVVDVLPWNLMISEIVRRLVPMTTASSQARLKATTSMTAIVSPTVTAITATVQEVTLARVTASAAVLLQLLIHTPSEVLAPHAQLAAQPNSHAPPLIVVTTLRTAQRSPRVVWHK